MAQKDKLDAIEVFQNLQDFATRSGATKSTFKVEREDGWQWEFAVMSPTYSEEKETEE